MDAGNRFLDIIEDYANITHFIDSLACALENGSDLPNFVPVLNDTLITDHLSKIAEAINKLRGQGT